MTLIFLFFDLTKIIKCFFSSNRKWLSKRICSSIMTPIHFSVLEGLSIKYIGNLFYVKFFEMLISCVLSIFSRKLLLISQLRILLVQLMRDELSLFFSGRIMYIIISSAML